ncbi:MAG: cytochrome P450 [Acidimicrobiales bacterium]
MSTSVDSYLEDLGPDDADISSHDTYVDGVPHATFERLRRDDPVSWHEEADGSGFWAVTSYQNCLTVSHEVETFTSSLGIRLEEMDPDQLVARRTLMETDPPDHTRLRRLLSRGFTRRTVETFEDGIRLLAASVLDEAVPKGEFDFVHDVAERLPMRMLGQLMGTPDSDGDMLVEWGDAMLGNSDPEYTEHVIDQADTEEYRMLPFRSPTALKVFQYAEELANDRRANPSDDIVTKLLAPTTDGEPLTDMEFKNFVTLLIAAGNDTTRYSIAHGLWVMARHPELWARWKNDPDLTDSAVEEIFRTGSVTMHFRRTATRDTELGGRQIKAGDKVLMWYISADHDDADFADPYRFDLARTPNDHMSFGRNGPHFCLGAWLARMELRVVFQELMKRVDHIELTDPVVRLRSNFMSGIKHMPVRVS